MIIYIPTKGRGPNQQITYNKLKAAASQCGFPMWIVCPVEEVQSFLDAGYPSVMGCPAERIGATRQWIIDNTEDPSVLMLDDDLGSWAVREHPGVGTYVPAAEWDLRNTLIKVSDYLEIFAHVGIGARLFANNQRAEETNARITRAWGIRADIIKKHGLKFTCPVDDLEMTIQLLRAGYMNRVIYTTVQDQKMSQAPGGASTYRTLEYHNACQEQIHRWHKNYTRLVEKTTAGGWFNGQPRKEIVIKWTLLELHFKPTTIDAWQEHSVETRDVD